MLINRPLISKNKAFFVTENHRIIQPQRGYNSVTHLPEPLIIKALERNTGYENQSCFRKTLVPDRFFKKEQYTLPYPGAIEGEFPQPL